MNEIIKNTKNELMTIDGLTRVVGKSYRHPVKRFAEYCEGKELTLNTVWDFYIETKNYSKSVRVLCIKMIRKLMKYMIAYREALGLDTKDAGWMLLEMKAPKQSKGLNEKIRNRIMEPEEIEKLISQSSEAHAAVYRVLAQTGVRKEAVVNMKHSELTFEGSVIYWDFLQKGDKEHMVTMDKITYYKALAAFPGESEYVFHNNGKPFNKGTFYDWIVEDSQKILGKRVTTHSFRHSFGTNFRKAGYDPKTISRAMGHSTVSTFLDYYDYTDEKLPLNYS